MARARNIKPALFKNEDLGQADPFVTILFIGLWCLADKEGMLEDRPLRIKAELFPYRDNFDINGYLTVLERLGNIRRFTYSGSDEIKVIQIVNFKKHQNPHHTEKVVLIPNFSSSCVVTVTSPLDTGYAPADSLIPDSLIPDSLIPDSNREAPASLVESKRKASDPALELFEFWKSVMHHHGAIFDSKRKKIIKEAFSLGYTLDQLKNAITGCSLTPHNMGKNENGTRYDGIHIILKDAAQIERFMQNSINPPSFNRRQNYAETLVSGVVDSMQNFALDNDFMGIGYDSRR